MSRIGLEVTKNRMRMNMTQKQLARAIGVSESFIRDVESGSKIVSDELFGKIAKVLDCDAGMLNMFSNDDYIEPKAPVKTIVAKPNVITEAAPVQQVWDDALGNILKTVAVYDYTMDKIISKRQLPIESNKVKGHPKDKVFYLIIADDDMSGLRIHKGDIGFCVLVNGIDKDGIYFLEQNGTRVIRQIKSLDQNDLILISNKNMLRTETVKKKDIKIIGKLIMLEISF